MMEHNARVIALLSERERPDCRETRGASRGPDRPASAAHHGSFCPGSHTAG